MRLLYTIIFTGLIGAVTIAAYNVSYNRFEKTALDTSAQRLSLYQESLRSTINRVSHLPRVVVSHPHTVEMLRDGKRVQLLNEYLKTVSDKADSAALYVLDHEATTVAASNFDTPESFVGNNYFSDTRNLGSELSHATYYINNPLWDGIGCASGSCCCQFNPPPPHGSVNLFLRLPQRVWK